MSLLRSFYRSRLSQKEDALLTKIESLYNEKPSRLVFQKGGDRFDAAECSNVAFDSSLATGTFEFTRPSGPIIKASKVIQDLTYTALVAGADGNSITIEYTDTETAGAEVVQVTGSAIVVGIESGVSTAQQVIDAIEADNDASALVSVVLSGSNDPQVTQAVTNLADGSDIETYDKADVKSIKRLRTKKYLIRFYDDADEQA